MRNVVKARLVAVTTVATLGLAACASHTPGTGTPASNAPTAVSKPSTSTSSGGSALAETDPCSLLTSTQASQNDLKSEGPSNDGGSRACSWSNGVAYDGLGYALELAIRDSQGLADINADGLTLSDESVGQHQAKQAVDQNNGDCLVIIGITQKSRVDIVISSGDSNPTHSCLMANKFAQLIEAKLP